MDYEKLSSDDQYRILEQRLRVYESKHFEASLNLEASQAVGSPQVPQLQKQLTDFEACIELARQHLAGMTPPAEPEPRAARRGARQS